MRRFAIFCGCIVSLALSACGADDSAATTTDGGQDSSPFDPGDGGFRSGDGGDSSSQGTTTLTAVIRDFKLYDSADPTTNPDFENPPAVAKNQNADDRGFVAKALGSDGVPAYALAGASFTVHGPQTFQQWYHDTPGTNIRVLYPLPLTANPDGSYGYDSQVSGVPYSPSDPSSKGFFPIDDGTQYQTAFGDQGDAHNYSFTVELHTKFTYKGGEYFNFRGDDDVFVFINQQLVIDLGGIHSPEPASVTVDSLGLTKGQEYPLDFFSAERHKFGSNILFTTTLGLKPVPPPN